jgi:hypothetical protein
MSAKHIIVICLITAIAGFSEVLTVKLEADQPIFDAINVKIEGFGKLRIPGLPVVPVKSIALALPPGARVTRVHCDLPVPHLYEPRTLSITPPFLPVSGSQRAQDDAISRWQTNKTLWETRSTVFPNVPCHVSKISHLGAIPYVRVIYYPLQLSAQDMRFFSSCEITIDYTTEKTENAISPWIVQNATEIFDNWEFVKHEYSTDMQNDSFNYVIITKDNLFSAFDSLINWKNSIGFSARCVSVDSIIAQYPGSETPDRIRNFLIDKYDEWGIQYVLIGGNVDLIPMKICFPDPEHEYDTPTDYYYAELNDDWDSDNDGYYGEYDQDSIGFTPEVIVGRFPHNTLTDLSTIVSKTVKFEQDIGSWKHNALLLGAFSNFANENGSGWPSCDGAVLMENMKDSLLSGWTCMRLYEDEGVCPSQWPHEQSLTESNVVAEWSSGQYAVTNWSGHGNSSGAYRKIWEYDDGDSIPEWNEIGSEAFMFISDPPSLNDDYASIVFAASCSNAASDDNLARELIFNGASGIVAATSYGWYTPGWEDPSDGNIMSLDYYFYSYLIAENQSVGQAIFSAKMFYFLNLYFPDPWGGDPEWTCQQNMLDYVLFGDPSLVRQGVGVSEYTTVDQPQGCCRVLPNPLSQEGHIEFVMNTSGNVRVVLYNCAGQRIGTLFQGRKDPGQHTVSFSTHNLASGVYFVSVVFEGSEEKMLTEKVVVF